MSHMNESCHIWMRYSHTYLCINTNIYMYTYACVHIYVLNMYIWVVKHIHVCIHIYIYIYTYMCISIYRLYMYTWVATHSCVAPLSNFTLLCFITHTLREIILSLSLRLPVYVYTSSGTQLCKTVSAENATSPKSTKSRN